jgi:4-oxalocrotonate tautomerase
MPFVNITYIDENIAADPEGKKAAVAKKIAQAISEEMGVTETSVWVVFQNVTARDWYVGEESVEQRRRKK